MNPSRHLRAHPLAGVRLILLYVLAVVVLALIATILQQGA